MCATLTGFAQSLEERVRCVRISNRVFATKLIAILRWPLFCHVCRLVLRKREQAQARAQGRSLSA